MSTWSPQRAGVVVARMSLASISPSLRREEITHPDDDVTNEPLTVTERSRAASSVASDRTLLSRDPLEPHAEPSHW